MQFLDGTKKKIPFSGVNAAPACVATFYHRSTFFILQVVVDIGDEHHRQFSQAQSNKVIHITTNPQCAQKDTLFPMIPQRGQCLLIEKKSRGVERASHTFSSFLPSQYGLFWLRLAMRSND